MANKEHVERLKRSIREWNAWRQEHHEIRPDLSHADLINADLSTINLIGTDLSHTDLINVNLNIANLSSARLGDANLSRANLSIADLSYADLSYADLSHTNLSIAKLSHTNLNGADLSYADLSHADLSHANLNHTNLNGANFDQTMFSQTTFAWIDLSNTNGLKTAIHYGPSAMDINLAALPTDEDTRLHFLRGVGFTETQIEYLPSLLTPRPIEYSSLFISYAHQDEAIAKRLYTDLRKKDIPCWFAPHDMKIGDKIRPRIDEAIYTHEKLLLILSEHSIASTWVEKEVETTLEREARQKRLVLFPVRLDESVMQTNQAWAADIRRMRHIGDFTRLSDDAAYQEAFSRLLRDLKVSK